MTNDILTEPKEHFTRADKFRQRVVRAYELSDYESFRKLSLASGWSESRIHRMFTGQFDNSKDGPGFFGIIRLCEKLGVTPNYLAGISQWQQSSSPATINALDFLQSIEGDEGRPTLSKLIHAYVRSGQRLEAFTQYLDYCDLYEMPNFETRKVTVRHIGERSLSAIRMGEPSALILQEAYERADPEFQEQIFSAHERAFHAGKTIETDAIDQRMVNHQKHVKIDYTRIAMRLSNAEGEECILIFCELIPQ